MRILHLSSLYPPHIVGGAERSVEFLAEQQVAMGHTVAASCIAPKSAPAEKRNGVTVYRMFHANDFWLEDWASHSRFERGYQKIKQQWNTKISKAFGAVLDEFKPDIVNTHSMVDVSTLTWKQAANRRIPIVHTLRDYDIICANAAMFRRGAPCEKWHAGCRLANISKLFTSKYVSGLAGVGSEIIQTHLKYGFFNHIPENLRRPIWNAALVRGGSVETRNAQIKTGPLRFGYLGRVNVEKGIMTMIDAFKTISQDRYSVLVAGEAPDSLAKYRKAADGLPIEFIGWAEPKSLLEAIDVLIVPSFWAEPLPRTILEAYAMGVNVIGARSGGIPELIGPDNKDWLFEPGDAIDLADRIKATLDKGRNRLPPPETFKSVLIETTPERVATKYLNLYSDVLAAHPH